MPGASVAMVAAGLFVGERATAAEGALVAADADDGVRSPRSRIGAKTAFAALMGQLGRVCVWFDAFRSWTVGYAPMSAKHRRSGGGCCVVAPARVAIHVRERISPACTSSVG